MIFPNDPMAWEAASGDLGQSSGEEGFGQPGHVSHKEGAIRLDWVARGEVPPGQVTYGTGKALLSQVVVEGASSAGKDTTTAPFFQLVPSLSLNWGWGGARLWGRALLQGCFPLFKSLTESGTSIIKYS